MHGHLHAVVKKGIFQLQKRHETLYALTNCRLITFRKCRIKRQGIFALTKKSAPILNPAIIFIIKTDHLWLHTSLTTFSSVGMWFPILCAIFGSATKYYFLKYLRREKRGKNLGNHCTATVQLKK